MQFGTFDVALGDGGGLPSGVSRLAWRNAAPRPAPYVTDPLTQLTDGQRDCLRLVYRHMTSKDIARTLGVSPHTVDMRLRTAMRTLSVASRIDAARLLIDSEGAPDLYQPLIYQSSELSGAAETANVGAPASTTSNDNAIHHDPWIRPDVGPPADGPPRSAGASRHTTPVDWASSDRPEQPLAGSVPWGARNNLTAPARLAWIALIAIGSSLAFGAILGALEALKKLL